MHITPAMSCVWHLRDVEQDVLGPEMVRGRRKGDETEPRYKCYESDVEDKVIG